MPTLFKLTDSWEVKKEAVRKHRLSTKKLYYLASPFTHKDETVQAKREYEVGRVACLLIKEYNLKLITPITASHRLTEIDPSIGGDWNTWKELDTLFVTRSDGLILVLMDGWDKSVGVTDELKIAKEHKIPIYYFEPFLNKFISKRYFNQFVKKGAVSLVKLPEKD